MKSIVILFGISGGGKTTLADYLVKHHDYAKIKTTTSRPKRTPDEDDYHFVTDQQFQKLPMFASTKFDQHYYGTNLADIHKLLSKYDRLVVVLTWSGIVNYVNKFRGTDVHIYPVELYCPLRTAVKRMDIRHDAHANKRNIIRRIDSYNHQSNNAYHSPINEYMINSYESLPKHDNLENESRQLNEIIRGE